MAKVFPYKRRLVVLLGGIVFGITAVLRGHLPLLPVMAPSTPFTSPAAVEQQPESSFMVVEQQRVNPHATLDNGITFVESQEQDPVSYDATDPVDIRQRVYEIQQLGATTGTDAIYTLGFTLQDPVAEIRMASIDSLRRIAAKIGDPEEFISTLFRNAAADTDSAVAEHASAALMELAESRP